MEKNRPIYIDESATSGRKFFLSESGNSLLLSAYMLLSFFYYIVVAPSLRMIFFGIFLGFSLIAFFILASKRAPLPYANISRKKILFQGLLYLFLASFMTIINNKLNPVILYIFLAPMFAYFVFVCRFNVRIFIVSIYVIALITLFHYFKHRSFDHFYPEMSRNYISVVLIVNVALLQIIQWKQNEKITLLTPAIGVIISMLAFGRSGIICSGLLFLNAIAINWKSTKSIKKIIYSTSIIIPLLILLIINWDQVVSILENFELLEKFSKQGFESRGRDYLKQEYLSHLNLKTFLIGYDFQHNPTFILYGQNPHNSFIRLHNFLGILFFPILFLIIRTLFRFVMGKNFFLLFISMAILLRAWTDTFLFLSFYDFILILLILLASNQTNRLKASVNSNQGMV